MAIPTGQVRARPPWPPYVQFQNDWSQVVRWLPMMEAASRKYPRASVPLIASVIQVETQGNHVWPAGHPKAGQVVTAGDAYGDGVASGLTQVKGRLWSSSFPGLDINDPADNIMMGAGLLDRWIDETGSWQGAIGRYHPGTSPNGTNQNSYVLTVDALMGEWEDADSPASGAGQRIADAALTVVGGRYVWGTAGPDSWDCSGLVAWAVKTATGREISRDSHAQFNLGEPVDKAALQPGDIVAFDTANGSEVREGNRASHVGILTSVNPLRMVNALNPSAGVVVSDPFSPYFQPLYLGARRIVADAEEPNVDDPFGLTVRIAIADGAGSNRPRQPIDGDVLWITIHETANPARTATAEMHRVFVNTGGGVDRVSFHFAVDDLEAVQILRLDEIGYHAGDGCDSIPSDTGCFRSIAIETCVNYPLGSSQWYRTLENLERLIALLITQPQRFVGGAGKRFSFDRIAPHQRWSGKNCPTRMLAGNLLPVVIDAARSLAGGTTPVPEPTYPKPDVLPAEAIALLKAGRDWTRADGVIFNAMPREFHATRETPRRRYADPDSTETVGPPIRAGEGFDAIAVVESRDRVWILTEWGTRVLNVDLTPLCLGFGKEAA